MMTLIARSASLAFLVDLSLVLQILLQLRILRELELDQRLVPASRHLEVHWPSAVVGLAGYV